MKKTIPDVLLLSGAALVSYGAWLAWHPAGYIIAGILALLAGARLASL